MGWPSNHHSVGLSITIFETQKLMEQQDTVNIFVVWPCPGHVWTDIMLGCWEQQLIHGNFFRWCFILFHWHSEKPCSFQWIWIIYTLNGGSGYSQPQVLQNLFESHGASVSFFAPGLRSHLRPFRKAWWRKATTGVPKSWGYPQKNRPFIDWEILWGYLNGGSPISGTPQKWHVWNERPFKLGGDFTTENRNNGGSIDQ